MKISKTDIRKNELIHSAVIRQLVIIGEAVKNIPLTIRKRYPMVPWSEIARTRDKLIHHYFGVDLDFVYAITKKHLPPFKKQIESIIKELMK